jgi:hypothetical protein
LSDNHSGLSWVGDFHDRRLVDIGQEYRFFEHDITVIRSIIHLPELFTIAAKNALEGRFRIIHKGTGADGKNSPGGPLSVNGSLQQSC